MKRILFIGLILATLTGLNSHLLAQPQYYNYNTNGSANSFPWNIAAGKDVQLLYLPGDFAQPTPAPSGNIISLSFRINSGYTFGPWTYTDLTIKMAQTTITSFTAGGFYSPMTTVYYRSSVSLSATPGGWLTLTLDTPFPYDPSMSLVIDVGQCGVPGATGYSSCYTAGTGNRRIYSVGGCPFAYSNISTSIYHVGFNLATAGPPIVVTTAATGVTGTGATLNGTVNANSASTTVSFEYGLTTAYGTTVPGVPATVTGSSVTPVSAAITGLTPATTYHYRVKGVNSQGSTNGNDMTFTTPAIPPIVVTDAATSVGATTATLNGTVDAGGASTAVTFEYGLTTAYGSTVTGVPSPVTGNTVTPVTANLTGLTTLVTYHYRIKGQNSAGTTNGNDMTFFTTNCPMPGAPGTITGPTSGCGNTPGNVFTCSPITNVINYNWTVPAGAQITNGANTNSITVTFGNTSGNVSVYGTNTCGNGPTSNLPVTVSALPVPTISGVDTMCPASGYYYYSTQTGMTNYTWTISSGGSVTGGQGTNQAQVTWTGTGPQWIKVNYTNAAGCSALTPTNLPIYVTPLPGPAGTISGPSAVCVGSTGVTFSVPSIPGALTYMWTLPAGATITGGSGTRTITVDFAQNASSGNITVYANNLCGNGTVSPPFALTVNLFPPEAGAIAGTPVVCTGATGVAYSTDPITNATSYLWTVPTGATIASGAGTNAITVNFGINPITGNVTVAGINGCGNGDFSEFAVTVNPTPPTPMVSIILPDYVLTSSAPMGNQWYFDGTAIPGATSQTYTPTESGDYWSVVTLDGCPSNESNHVALVMTGVDEKSGTSLSVRPNPNDGIFTLSIITQKKTTYGVTIYNNLGSAVLNIPEVEVSGTFEKQIDLSAEPKGIYTVVMSSGETKIVRKVVLN